MSQTQEMLQIYEIWMCCSINSAMVFRVESLKNLKHALYKGLRPNPSTF